MINTVFLQPLPVEKPAELMYVYGTDSNNTQSSLFGTFLPISYPNYVDYKTRTMCFSELAAQGSFPNAVSLPRPVEKKPALGERTTGIWKSLFYPA